MSCPHRRVRMQVRWFYEEYQIGKLLSSLCVVAAIWFVAALVICRAERTEAERCGVPTERFGTLRDCLWGATVYLVSGLEEFEPRSPASKAAAVTVMIAGVGALGMLGARLAATFVEHARRRGLLRRLPGGKLQGHIVICGWPANGERLLAELRTACDTGATIVVVDEGADDIRLPDHRAWPDVWGLAGDPSDDTALRLAQVEQAHSAIVYPPPTGSDDRRVRARELMIVLALRTVSPSLHITVPAPRDRSVARLLDRQRVELPRVEGVSSRLIAHASQRHFLSLFFERLLACENGTSSVREIPLPAFLVGRTFPEAQRQLASRSDGDLTLVAIRRPTADGQGQLAVNPRRDDGRHVPFSPDDRILVLARTCTSLDQPCI